MENTRILYLWALSLQYVIIKLKQLNLLSMLFYSSKVLHILTHLKDNRSKTLANGVSICPRCNLILCTLITLTVGVHKEPMKAAQIFLKTRRRFT